MLESELGPNQDIDELYITHINAGEPINPNDETSANYPEDVVHLSGSRLVDGSVLIVVTGMEQLTYTKFLIDGMENILLVNSFT